MAKSLDDNIAKKSNFDWKEFIPIAGAVIAEQKERRGEKSYLINEKYISGALYHGVAAMGAIFSLLYAVSFFTDK